MIPAVLAAGAYLIGIAVAVIVRNPWPWVLGAWAAPLAYSGASHWLVDFACFARAHRHGDGSTSGFASGAGVTHWSARQRATPAGGRAVGHQRYG